MGSATLSDAARDGQNIAVACSCGHKEILAGVALERLFFLQHWDPTLTKLGRHLRCGRCQHKSLLVTLTGQAHTKTIGPATEREWRQLQKRLRD